MGSHDPFGYLKHKLWPREGTKVKLSICFPTIKSWESPWFTCVKVLCHIALEKYWQGLQIFFGLHFTQSSTQEVMAFQNHENPNFENFETPKLGVLEQNDI
jgi:hypothetical protein